MTHSTAFQLRHAAALAPGWADRSRLRMAARLQQPAQEGNMGVLGWIVFGLIVGIVAKLLMPGRDPGGFIVTILLGIVGAMLGGFFGRVIGWYGPNDPAGF